jgi:hypothetical protein
MVTHMKTTIEIADSLFAQAKEVAARDGTTLRALVEEGLRFVLGQRRSSREPFRLRKVTFGGRGLQPGIEEGDWDAIRDLVHRGRGS